MNGDTSYDFSQLTDEERKEAERQITQDLATLGGSETQEQKDVKTALAGAKHDDTKRRIEDSKRFDETLESEAASVGASTDALKLYALAQEKAAKVNRIQVIGNAVTVMDNAIVNIYNAAGALVAQTTVAGVKSVSLADNAAGLYLVEAIFADGARQVVKVIK